MRWTPDQIGDLSGTTALVTGANSGIGLVEARELARHGADVVLAVRNTDAGEAAAARIRGIGVPGAVRVERLDLASQESRARTGRPVRGAAAPARQQRGRHDSPEVPRDDRRLRAAVRHQPPRPLRADRSADAPAARGARPPGDDRVVDRAPQRRRCGLRGQPRRRLQRQRAYGRSKLANLLFATELQRRATASGSTLTSTAAHPGISGTNLIASPDGMGATPVIGTLTQWVARAGLPRPRRTARRPCSTLPRGGPRLVLGPDRVPGDPRPGRRGEAQHLGAGRDAAAALLWERSEELTGVTVTP